MHTLNNQRLWKLYNYSNYHKFIILPKSKIWLDNNQRWIDKLVYPIHTTCKWRLFTYPAYILYFWNTGLEFRFLLLSTSEPTTSDGYIKNPTKSLCDPFVFNTAITRAKSLIVSVGNPFLLLEVEKLMIMRYGEKGKCWSTYLGYCLRNKTISFGGSLKLSSTEQTKILSKLQEIVEERLIHDFTTESIPAMDRKMFANADEFPLVSQIAAQVKQVHKTEKIKSDEGESA